MYLDSMVTYVTVAATSLSLFQACSSLCCVMPAHLLNLVFARYQRTSNIGRWQCLEKNVSRSCEKHKVVQRQLPILQ